MINQDQRRLDILRRATNWTVETLIGAEAVLRLESVGLALGLGELYE